MLNSWPELAKAVAVNHNPSIGLVVLPMSIESFLCWFTCGTGRASISSIRPRMEFRKCRKIRPGVGVALLSLSRDISASEAP